MTHNQIKKLQEIEDSILDFTKENTSHVYRRFDFYWIRSFDFPFKAYEELSAIPSIRRFPKLEFRSWAIWLFSSFYMKRIQKSDIISLLGVMPAWFLMKKQEIDLHANFIYSRNNLVTLIYPKIKNPYVLKIKLNSPRAFKNESHYLQMGEMISHKIVRTPKFINGGSFKDSSWYLQELVQGKEVTSFNSFKRRKVYQHVFEFMILFYKKNGIVLKTPDLDILLKNKVVSDFFLRNKSGFILETIENLQKTKKNMFWTIIHNDLYHKNILVGSDENIFIIDWGNTIENYLVHDFKNKEFEKEKIFKKITKDFNLSQELIYNLEEQIFIEEFIEICQMIKKLEKKKNQKLYKYRIKNRINMLKIK